MKNEAHLWHCRGEGRHIEYCMGRVGCHIPHAATPWLRSLFKGYKATQWYARFRRACVDSAFCASHTAVKSKQTWSNAKWDTGCSRLQVRYALLQCSLHLLLVAISTSYPQSSLHLRGSLAKGNIWIKNWSRNMPWISLFAAQDRAHLSRSAVHEEFEAIELQRVCSILTASPPQPDGDGICVL